MCNRLILIARASFIALSGINHFILLYGVNPRSSGSFFILSVLCGYNVPSVKCVKGCPSFSYFLTFILIFAPFSIKCALFLFLSCASFFACSRLTMFFNFSSVSSPSLSVSLGSSSLSGWVVCSGCVSSFMYSNNINLNGLLNVR